MSRSTIRVLAIASAGGHWVQLRRLRPAWEGCNVIYVTTSESRREEIFIKEDTPTPHTPPPQFYVILDANRWEKFKLLKQLFQIFGILIRERPDVIISTGAAPGFFALKFGKLLGAKTIWLDSIANVTSLSLSGKKIAQSADLWLTQWEHLTTKNINGSYPQYKGSII